METGELKSLVIHSIRTLKEASIHEILEFINDLSEKDYAYTTIATIVSRLEDDNIVEGVKKKKDDRKRTYYSIVSNAHVEDAQNFLQSYVQKFGDLGIKHLGDMLGTKLDNKKLNEIKKKISQVEN